MKTILKSPMRQAISTILFFAVFGHLFFVYGFSLNPQGYGGKMEYSAFSLALSILWVILIWGLFIISGAHKAKGVLCGYSIVVCSCFLFLPLFYYLAPITSIHYLIVTLTDYRQNNLIIELIAYTILNYFAWVIGCILFSKKQAHPKEQSS